MLDVRAHLARSDEAPTLALGQHTLEPRVELAHGRLGLHEVGGRRLSPPPRPEGPAPGSSACARAIRPSASGVPAIEPVWAIRPSASSRFFEIRADALVRLTLCKRPCLAACPLRTPPCERRGAAGSASSRPIATARRARGACASGDGPSPPDGTPAVSSDPAGS